MPRLPRILLAAVLVAAPLAARAAEPVRVTLPKGTAPKAAAPPVALTAEETKKGPNRAVLNSRGQFQLDFDKVDVDKLVQTISEMTGKLFILSENIRGKITIIGPEHGKIGVTADEAYAAFLAALDANGLTTYPVGKYIKITEKRTAKGTNIPTLIEADAPYTTNEQMVTKLFKLRYVEAEPVRAVIQQLVSRDGDSATFPPDVIIVNDLGLNMHRLERIIERLDSPSSNDEIRVLQVQFATATDIAEKLRQVFEEKNRRPGQRPGQATIAPPPGQPAAPPMPGALAAGGENVPASLSQIIADDRTNKLVIIANDKAFQRILEILKHLDTPIPGEGQVHVHYLANANAEELATTLASLTQGIANKGARPPNPGGGKGPTTVADLFSGEVKITADKGTNSLVIIANNSDYRNVINVVEKLDHPRRQVFIEAVIMEVNLRNSNQFGLSVHAGKQVSLQSPNDSLAVVGSEPSGLSSLGGVASLATMGGFLAGLQGPNISIAGLNIPSFSIVLQALQSSTDTNILSTPHLLATDNEDAEITVGQNVPFQAGITSPLLNNLAGSTGTALATSSLLGASSGLIAPIQRQNVELKLKIKPQINDGDFIRMLIEEQIEEIASKDPTLGPTTSKRTAKTTVVSRDQNTVVLGGLIQERVLESVSKTPILGDIPLLGRLFRFTTTDKTRLNLLLFLTPYIIRDQTDFRRIFERKMKERQEFVEQFYGRQPGYEVPIDYTHKAGPLAMMFKSLDLEAKKVENGGPGIPGQRVITPRGFNPYAPPVGAQSNPATPTPAAPPVAPPAAPPAAPEPAPRPEPQGLGPAPSGSSAAPPTVKEPPSPAEGVR